MIPLLLLLCLSIYSPYIIQAAPFNYKNIEAGKTMPSSVSSDDDAYDADDEQITDEDDDFYTDLEKNISFRTKLSRSMRSIKKHTALIISSLGLCAVGFMYWYKIWPFNTSLPTTNSSNATVETSADSIQGSAQKAVHVNKQDEIPTSTPVSITISDQNKQNEEKNIVDKNFKEALENEIKKYESTDHLQKDLDDIQQFIHDLEKR